MKALFSVSWQTNLAPTRPSRATGQGAVVTDADLAARLLWVQDADQNT